MTDRFHAITVVLEKDIRDDDAEAVMNAIRCLRGVLSVSGEVADSALFTAEMRAKRVWRDKLLKLLEDADA